MDTVAKVVRFKETFWSGVQSYEVNRFIGRIPDAIVNAKAYARMQSRIHSTTEHAEYKFVVSVWNDELKMFVNVATYEGGYEV